MTLVSKDISKAIAFLLNEDVVAIPTETVYGLAGNIYSENAIKKIFSLKKRPFYNPLIVHISSLEQLDNIVSSIPPKALKLAKAFWPGSLTLVLSKKDSIPNLITAGKNTVAVRIPNHPLALALLKSLPFPLAAPSANPFGNISPTNAMHVAAYFNNDLPMVLDGGACEKGLESTIIGFEKETPIIYRLGSISIEEIVEVVGDVTIKNKSEITSLSAPGMLSRHYAPKTKTYLVPDVASFIENQIDKKIGVIVFSEAKNIRQVKRIEILSSKGDLKEAASKLYDSLHSLDKLDLDMIVAELFPEVGLGKTINDRLRRATKDK